MRLMWLLLAFVAVFALSAPKALAAVPSKSTERTLQGKPSALVDGTTMRVPPPPEVRLIRLVKPKKPRRVISLAPTSFRLLKPTDEIGIAQAVRFKLRRARPRARRRSRAPGSGPGADPVPPARRAGGSA